MIRYSVCGIFILGISFPYVYVAYVVSMYVLLSPIVENLMASIDEDFLLKRVEILPLSSSYSIPHFFIFNSLLIFYVHQSYIKFNKFVIFLSIFQHPYIPNWFLGGFLCHSIWGGLLCMHLPYTPNLVSIYCTNIFLSIRSEYYPGLPFTSSAKMLAQR